MYTAPPNPPRWRYSVLVYVVWALDYSQMELRIAASMSRDPEMLRLLNAGVNMHDALVEQVKRMTGRTVPYVAAKRINFGVQYQGKVPAMKRSLARERVLLDDDAIQEMLDAHESMYPTYHAWSRAEGEAAVARGYAETLWGRRYYDPLLVSSDPTAQQEAMRSAVAVAISGTGADIVKGLMVDCVPVLREYDASLIVQVHDEIVGYVGAEHGEAFTEALTTLAESYELPGVRLVANMSLAANWALAH